MVGTLDYRDGLLFMEDAPLDRIAQQAGTPCYVYSSSAILRRYEEYDRAFGAVPHKICYAVKANSNLAVLGLLARAGSGFDIVSGGELFRVIRAGGDPAQVVYSGVGKTPAEVEYAIEQGIHSFNCESEAELALVDSLAARAGKRASVSIRVNPDVDAETHPYIATGLREHKFGIDMAEVLDVYERARRFRNLKLEGVSCHIGSQLLNPAPLVESLERMLELVERLRAAGLPIRTLDLGGGLGVAYCRQEQTPSIGAYVGEVCRRVAGHELTLIVEPGRSLVAEAGVLLSRVLYRKRNQGKEFVIVDAAMNDLLRPSLYSAYHEIVPVRRDERRGMITADVVGPVCESGDFLARDRKIANVLPGDLVAICTAGAYGFVLSSNYNARGRAAEVLVSGQSWRIVRRRESYEDLVRGEVV